MSISSTGRQAGGRFAPKVIKCAAYGVAQGRGAGLALL